VRVYARHRPICAICSRVLPTSCSTVCLAILWSSHAAICSICSKSGIWIWHPIWKATRTAIKTKLLVTEGHVSVPVVRHAHTCRFAATLSSTYQAACAIILQAVKAPKFSVKRTLHAKVVACS